MRFCSEDNYGERNDKPTRFSDRRQYLGALQWRKEAGTRKRANQGSPPQSRSPEPVLKDKI